MKIRTVNLLPEEAKEEKQSSVSLQYLIFGAIIVFVIIILVDVGLYVMKFVNSNKGEDYRKEIEAVDTQLKTMATAEQEVKFLYSQYATFSAVQAESKNFVELNKSITDNLPKEVKLDSIQIKVGEDKQLMLSGKADTRKDVLIFLNALNEKSKFTEAVFTNTSQSVENNKETVKFEISAKIKP